MQQLTRRFEVSEGGCWVWQGALDTHGYPHIRMGSKGVAIDLLVSRVVWALWYGFNGRTGLEVDHVCCNQKCINPEHLQLLGPKVNATVNRAANRRKSSINDETAEKIREMHSRGFTYEKIRELLGLERVTVPTIWRAAHRPR
jgi:hypothetical protein